MDAFQFRVPIRNSYLTDGLWIAGLVFAELDLGVTAISFDLLYHNNKPHCQKPGNLSIVIWSLILALQIHDSRAFEQ